MNWTHWKPGIFGSFTGLGSGWALGQILLWLMHEKHWITELRLSYPSPNAGWLWKVILRINKPAEVSWVRTHAQASVYTISVGINLKLLHGGFFWWDVRDTGHDVRGGRWSNKRSRYHLQIRMEQRHFCVRRVTPWALIMKMCWECVPVLFLCLSCSSADLHFDALLQDHPPSERSSPAEQKICTCWYL